MKPATTGLFSRLKPWALAGLGLLVLAVAFFSSRIVAPGISINLDAPGRVVVLPIRNATGEPEHDWVRFGLMEMMAETLRRTEGVGVVPPDRLISITRARELNPEDSEMRRRIRQFGIALGGEIVLEVTALRNTTRGAREDQLYSLRFEATHPGGEELANGELQGSDPARIAERLTHLFAGALSGRSEPVTLRGVFSSSPFLNRLYGMGLTELVTNGPDSAIPHFQIALKVQPSFLAAQYRIAECLRRGGRLDESLELTLSLLREAQNRGETVWEVRALHALARVHALAGRTEKAVELATQVQGHPGVREDPTVPLEALGDLARFSLVGSDTEHSRKLFGEIGERQERLGDRLGRVDTLAQIGALALRADDLPIAVRALEEAQSLASELGDVRTEMRLLTSLGEVASRRGQRRDAAELWGRAMTFYEQRGEVERQLLLQRNIAETLLIEQDLDGAEKAFRDVLELAVGRGDEYLEGLASLRLTWILLRRGYPYQARAHLNRAIELDQSLEQPLMLQRMIAWMAYEEGNFQLALNTLVTVKRQAGENWNELDEDFLTVFAKAIDQRKRLPVPGEQATLGAGALGPGP